MVALLWLVLGSRWVSGGGGVKGRRGCCGVVVVGAGDTCEVVNIGHWIVGADSVLREEDSLLRF